jgi:hypothetical protein
MKVTQAGFIEGSAAETPPTGVVTLYAKGTGVLYSKDDTGVETQLGTPGTAPGTVTDVSSADANITVINNSTTPVITLVQAPALKSATTTVNVSSATAPTNGQVLTATSSTAATWQTPTTQTRPAFSAYQSVAQTLSLGASTKILFQTEEFDNNSNFASSTFTPTVSGSYLVGGSIAMAGATSSTTIQLAVHLNGAFFKQLALVRAGSGFAPYAIGSTSVPVNGSTDYIELFVTRGGEGGDTSASQGFTNFYGFKIS